MMRIEKRFFDEEQAFREKIEQEIAAEEALKTEEQKASEKRNALLEIEAIKQEVSLHRVEHPKILNPKKVEAFNRVSKGALALAELEKLNIVIEEIGQYKAQIKLQGQSFMFPDFTEPIFKEMFIDLIRSADDLAINASGDRLTMQFFFDLCDEL